MTRTDDALAVCVIGAGPRGLSVLERICANARGVGRPVERPPRRPVPAGPGRGLAHGPAGRTADEHGRLAGDPVHRRQRGLRGPSVPGRACTSGRARSATGTSRTASAGTSHRPCPHGRWRRRGASAPTTYPTRAFYGHYLDWVFRQVVRTAPAHVTVRTHRSTRVDRRSTLARTTAGRPQTVTLADGARLAGLDAVVLALGHGAVARADEERASARLRPAATACPTSPPRNPADVDLSRDRARHAGRAARPGPELLRLHGAAHRGRGGRFDRTGGRPGLPALAAASPCCTRVPGAACRTTPAARTRRARTAVTSPGC